MQMHGPETFGLTCWFKPLNQFQLYQIKKSASADFFINGFLILLFVQFVFNLFFTFYFLFLAVSSKDFKKANFSLILASNPRSVG
jgi:hypothetical protein